MSNEKQSRGIIRNIDDLGRVVVPKAFRKILKMEKGEPVEMELVDNAIVIRKPKDNCRACDGLLTKEQMNGKFNLCTKCINEIKNLE